MSFEKLLLVALLISLSGCASQAPSVRLRIAGGERITVDLGRGGVVGGENKDVKIGTAGFLTNTQQRKGVYVFGIEFKNAATPRSVKIDDVTDDRVLPMVDDSDAKVAGRIWRWTCPPIALDDAMLKWIREIDDSFRVYRILIILGDGRQVKLYHAVFYPAFAKERIRKELGEGPS